MILRIHPTVTRKEPQTMDESTTKKKTVTVDGRPIIVSIEGQNDATVSDVIAVALTAIEAAYPT